MEVKGEFLDILQRAWAKLQGLPQASYLELSTFLVIILFGATVLFMVLLSCTHCCCIGKPRYQASRVQPV